MDELGWKLAGLADEVARVARAAGPAKARRRGARRRRRQAAATVLLVACVVAAAAGLGRWTAATAPATAPATAGPPPQAPHWFPFEPFPAPEVRPRGKPVLVAQRTLAGQPLRFWAFPARLRGQPGLQVCVAVQDPGGGGGTGCAPATRPVTISSSALADTAELVHGHVSKRAHQVRLELARAGAPLPPLTVRPLASGPHLPVNLWYGIIGRTVDVRRVVLLDGRGREIASGRGLPAVLELLPPAGPVTVLGHAPSVTGPLRIATYVAEAAYTCIQVIPDQRPEDGFVKCAPPAPARRPALEASWICSGPSAVVYGTSERTAKRVRVELTRGAPVEGPAFDAGAANGRSYWAVAIPTGREVARVVALDANGSALADAAAPGRAVCG